jgi:hypothetical protein
LPPNAYSSMHLAEYNSTVKLFGRIRIMDEKETLYIKIINIDSPFLESIEPESILIIEIDRIKRELVIREEKSPERSYALIDAEIIDRDYNQ